MMKIVGTMILAGMLTGGVCATAQDKAPAEPGARGQDRAQRGQQAKGELKRMDTDGDGKISEAEFICARTEQLKAMFGRIDADKDGFVTEEEMRSARQRGPQGPAAERAKE